MDDKYIYGKYIVKQIYYIFHKCNDIIIQTNNMFFRMIGPCGFVCETYEILCEAYNMKDCAGET